MKSEQEKLARKFLAEFNRIRSTNYKSINSFLDNFSHWLSIYSLEEMIRATENARNDDWFDDALNPDLLFRRRNKNGECDYLGQLLNLKPAESRVIKI